MCQFQLEKLLCDINCLMIAFIRKESAIVDFITTDCYEPINIWNFIPKCPQTYQTVRQKNNLINWICKVKRVLSAPLHNLSYISKVNSVYNTRKIYKTRTIRKQNLKSDQKPLLSKEWCLRFWEKRKWQRHNSDKNF